MQALYTRPHCGAAGFEAVPRRRHAVVVGGSLAGMLAARVLSDHFERVTLLERDRFPETPAARKGLPQGRHCARPAGARPPDPGAAPPGPDRRAGADRRDALYRRRVALGLRPPYRPFVRPSFRTTIHRSKT